MNPAHSHMQVFTPLLAELVRKGHNLTVISNFELGIVGNNFRGINLKMPPIKEMFVLDENRNLKWFQINTPIMMSKRAIEHCNEFFSNNEIKRLLKSRDGFDLILTEFFCTDCSLAFADEFGIPAIGISSSPILAWHNERFANIDNPSYIPNTLMLYSNRMSFWERVENFVSIHFQNFIYNNIILENDAQIIEKHTGKRIPSMKSLINKHSSLLLVNSHFSLSLPRPMVPNVVEVGGIHLKEPRKLPEVSETYCGTNRRNRRQLTK